MNKIGDENFASPLSVSFFSESDAIITKTSYSSSIVNYRENTHKRTEFNAKIIVRGTLIHAILKRSRPCEMTGEGEKVTQYLQVRKVIDRQENLWQASNNNISNAAGMCH